MLEIIFNGITLLGVLSLATAFCYKAIAHEKEMNNKHYEKLSESISDGVYSAFVRWDNYNLWSNKGD